MRSWLVANEDLARRFLRGYVLGVHRFKADRAFALDVLRKYLEVDDPTILEDTHEQFSRYIESVPYISEEGFARLLADLAGEEPRAAGQTPAQYIDHRLLRELEASGFLRQVGGA